MKQQGNNVTMFCQKANPGDSEVVEYEGIRVIRYDFPRTMVLDPFKFRKQMEAAMEVGRRHLLDVHWDVVHSHLPMEGAMIRKLLPDGPRFVHTSHSPVIMEQEITWGAQGWAGRVKKVFGKAPLRRLERKLLCSMDGIQTLSRFTRDQLDGAYGIGSKIDVVPHWCREDFRRVNTKMESRRLLGIDPGLKVLFTLRHLGPRYGVDVAIKAIAPILKKNDDLVFIVGGDGPLRPAFESLANDLGVKDQVRFLGRLTDEDLRLYYETADLFVLPTLALECFGLIVLEAFAYGMPIVSTDAGALPELMEPILPEFLVPAGDEKALRSKVEMFVEGSLQPPTPAVVESHVKEHFSQESIVPRILALVAG
jgi:glycosyltransferase involved in cell wall biosynthesis